MLPMEDSRTLWTHACIHIKMKDHVIGTTDLTDESFSLTQLHGAAHTTTAQMLASLAYMAVISDMTGKLPVYVIDFRDKHTTC